MTSWTARAVERLAPFEAVLFDLDGTLLVLDVDWTRAHREMVAFAAERGHTVRERSVWGILRETQGLEREGVERILRRHEEEGARRSARLPLADLLPLLPGTARGVVSLNARSACLTALERHGLTPYLQAIVAREDATRLKPDPEPLLRCLERLGRSPAAAVFVGDRERDRETAERGGTAFLHVDALTT